MLWHKNLVSFMIISSIKLKNHNLWMNLVGNEFSDSVGKRNDSILYQIRSVKIIILYLEKKSIIIMFPFCKNIFIFFSFLMNKKSIANILNINNKSASSMQINFSYYLFRSVSLIQTSDIIRNKSLWIIRFHFIAMKIFLSI